VGSGRDPGGVTGGISKLLRLERGKGTYLLEPWESEGFLQVLEETMTKSEAKQVIRGKVADWIDSVEDIRLREEMSDGVMVAGGAFASLMRDEDPRDYDVYFRTERLRDLAVDYYKVSNSSCVIEWTRFAITLYGDIQLILNPTGDPEGLFQYFDFLHCMTAWCSWDDLIRPHPGSIGAIRLGRLQYTPCPRPINAIKRMVKFLGRGWAIDDEQIDKIALAIYELDLSKPEERRRQLLEGYQGDGV
jgi:hypothetical protein